MIRAVLSPFVAAMLLVSVSSANSVYSEVQMSTMDKQKQMPEQKALNTIQDYNSMVADLKQGAALGDSDSNFYLGFVYLSGITLKDGTIIKPNITEGTSILLNAISLGSAKALSVLAAKSIENADVVTLSETVKVAQSTDSIDIENKDYYSLLLASLILDKNSNEAIPIETATKWLFEAEKKRPTPKMQYILASMYAKLQNMNAANYYLNKSCSNTQLDEQMQHMCKQFAGDGGTNEETCQKP